MQMLTEIGAENNTTTVVMLPSDLINLARDWSSQLRNTTTESCSEDT